MGQESTAEEEGAINCYVLAKQYTCTRMNKNGDVIYEYPCPPIVHWLISSLTFLWSSLVLRQISNTCTCTKSKTYCIGIHKLQHLLYKIKCLCSVSIAMPAVRI